jgi:hypothetical protein
VRFKKVWLVHPKTGGGRVDAHPDYYVPPSSPDAWEEDAIISTAGPFAQRRYAPRSQLWKCVAGDEGLIYNRIITRPKSDWDYYWYAINKLVPVGCCAATVKRIDARTIALLKAHWAEVKLLARALLERKTLTEREVYQLLKRSPPRRVRPKKKTSANFELCY